MNIARMLGIPRDVGAAAEIISTAVPRRIDVGLANERTHFYEACSIGLSAAVLDELHRTGESRLTGALAAVRAAFDYRPSRMTIAIDGVRLHGRPLAVVVANGPYMGLGFTVAPQARLDDGRFDVVVFQHSSKWDLARHFASIALGRRGGAADVSRYTATSVEVASARPLATRADGIDLGETPATFGILPSALTVLAPDPSFIASPA